MGLPALKPATYEDLFDVPDHCVGEIIAGEIYVSPRPAFPHTRASSVLSADLGSPFMRGRGGPGGWWVFSEPELHLCGDILVPDLAGWRRARMPDPPNTAFTTLAPDWVCEILSPSTFRLDRGQKLHTYAREEVAHLWLLDPIAKTLEVLRLQEGKWLITDVHTGNAKVRIPPFEAVELELAALWGEDEDEGIAKAQATSASEGDPDPKT